MTNQTPPTRLRFALAFAIALACGSGCAHYGWSDDAEHRSDESETGDDVPVAVETIAGRASEGMRLERLTREFVETLQSQGMRGARWSEVAGEDYVECVVSETEIGGFGRQWNASASVECSVRCGARNFQLEQRGKAMRSGSNRPEDVASEHRVQAESAARRALRKAAVAIASRCG
ncbi:MAG: hypothetical protein ACQEVA_13665 [Myxococcota bacterium]